MTKNKDVKDLSKEEKDEIKSQFHAIEAEDAATKQGFFLKAFRKFDGEVFTREMYRDNKVTEIVSDEIIGQHFAAYQAFKGELKENKNLEKEAIDNVDNDPALVPVLSADGRILVGSPEIIERAKKGEFGPKDGKDKPDYKSSESLDSKKARTKTGEEVREESIDSKKDATAAKLKVRSDIASGELDI